MADLSGLGDLVLTVGGDISPLENALGQIPAAANNAAAEIKAAFDAIPSATEGVQASLAGLAAGLGEAGKAAGDTTPKLEGMKPPLDDVKDSAEKAGSSFDEFVKQAAKVAGITITIEALREAAVEAAKAFASEETSLISLTAILGNNAEAGNQALNMAKQLAQQFGFTQDAVVRTTQQLLALQVPLSQVPHLIEGISTGARGMNVDFQTASSRMELIAQSGQLMARSLTNLTLNVQDIGRAMGMATTDSETIKKAFAGITDEAQRFAIVANAELAKFPTLANDAASGTEGAWTRMKNAAEDAMQEVGRQISSFKGLLDGLVAGIKFLADVAIEVLGALKMLGDGLVGLGKISADIGQGIASIFADELKGNFSAVSGDIDKMLSSLRDDSKAALGSITDDMKATGSTLDNLWGTTAASVSSSTTKMAGDVKAATDSMVSNFQQVGNVVNIIVQNAVNAFDKAAAAFSEGAISVQSYVKALEALNQAQKDANGGVENAKTAMLLVAASFRELQVNAANAQITLSATAADMRNGAASATQYTAALQALNAAQEALHGGLQNAHTALLLAVDDFNKLTVQTTNAKTYLDAVVIAFQNHKATIGEVSAALDAYNKLLMETNNGLSDLATQEGMAVIAFRELGTAADNASISLEAVWTEYQKHLATLPQLTGAVDAYVKAQIAAAGGVESWQVAEVKLAAEQAKVNLALQNSNTELAKAAQMYADGEITLGVYTKAVDAHNTALKNVDGSAKNVTDSTKAATAAQSGLQDAFSKLSGTAQMAADVNNTYATSLQYIGGQWVNLGGQSITATRAVSDLATTLQMVNGQFVNVGTSSAAAVPAVSEFATTLAKVNGQFVNIGTSAGTAASGIASVGAAAAGAAEQIRTAADQMAEFDAAMGDVGGGSLGQQLDRSMTAKLPGMSASLRPGDMFANMSASQPFNVYGDITGLMPAPTENTRFGTPQQIIDFGKALVAQNKAIDDAAAALKNAGASVSKGGTDLSAAVIPFQDAATLQYEAAKASGQLADSLQTAADDISASALAAADAANQAAFDNSQLVIDATNVVADASKTVAASNTLVVAAASALAATIPGFTSGGSSTFLESSHGTTSLPSIGPSGSNTMLMANPWTEGYAPYVGSGPTGAGVTVQVTGNTIDSQASAEQLAMRIVSVLQTKGVRIGA